MRPCIIMNLAQSYTEEVRKTIPFQQNTLARQYTKREKRNSILNIVCWKCCMIKIIILIGKNVIYLQYHFKSIFWSKDIPKKKEWDQKYFEYILLKILWNKTYHFDCKIYTFRNFFGECPWSECFLGLFY